MSKVRKGRKRRSAQRKRSMMGKNRKHWKNVWEKARKMAWNFSSNVFNLTISDLIVKSKF
jgi:hypothetical protein